MGAIMATGLLDAGGRNVAIGTRSRSGYFRRTSTVGLAIFLQYWCAARCALQHWPGRSHQTYSQELSRALQLG